SRKIRPTTTIRPNPNWVNCVIKDAPASPLAAGAATKGMTMAAGRAGSRTRSHRMSAKLLDAFGLADHVSQTDAEFLVDHHHFAVGNQGAIDLDVQRLAGEAIELYYRALVELQQVADGDIGIAHFHGDGHRNIQDHVKIGAVDATEQLTAGLPGRRVRSEEH